MFSEALRSRSNTAPQPQIWVLVDSIFLTVLPQAENNLGKCTQEQQRLVFYRIFSRNIATIEQTDPMLIAN